MPETTLKPKTNQLSELSNDLKVITAEINAYKQIAGESIFEIGKRLKAVRDNPEKYGLKGYRDWERWVEERCDITRRTANRFIQAYEQFGTTSSQLSTGKIFELLQLPADIDRHKFIEQPHVIPSTGEVKTVEEMTVRELREVKKALQEERRRREQAEKALEEEKKKPPKVEVRTEYIKVEDTEAREKLRQYEERFGSLDIYDENVIRIKSETEVIGSALAFAEDVRQFVKKYAFLENYAAEFPVMNESAKREYVGAINVMLKFMTKLHQLMENRRYAEVIDIH